MVLKTNNKKYYSQQISIIPKYKHHFITQMRVLNNKNAALSAQKYHICIIYKMIPVPIKAVACTK